MLGKGIWIIPFNKYFGYIFNILRGRTDKNIIFSCFHNPFAKQRVIIRQFGDRNSDIDVFFLALF